MAWVDENKEDRLTNMVDSTRRRLRAPIRLKGARTGYGGDCAVGQTGTSVLDRVQVGRVRRRLLHSEPKRKDKQKTTSQEMD